MSISQDGLVLVEQYKEMFSDPEFRKDYAGAGWQFVLDVFLRYTRDMESYTLLDYGCGTASQLYAKVTALQGKTFHQLVQGKCQAYYCYDPAVRKYARRPDDGTKFSIVVCLEVMEHILEQDIDATLRDIESFLEPDGVVFFSIAYGPSRTLMPDGTDPHVTRQPFEWWKQRLTAVFGKRFFLCHHQ